ncbi:dynamin family protein [Exiguobacterium acetylicum]|uniref:dynamin family protein n=1 Tax=Exiguobacterium acetylicum TaxID=41170 RepID=UPI003977CC1A
MITNYSQIKEEVLEMYKSFLGVIDEVKFPIDHKSIVALNNQAENIRKDRFLLMIAGEAKSGKSTFINAFLGQEILPMDVKQCTSSIIEIRYGIDYSLIATYASDRTKNIAGEEEIKKFLLENAALNDDYREIPVTTINNEILIKYKGKIPERVISDVINGVQSENIYGLSPEEYNKKIRSYIKNHKNNWADIVTKMIITYPFDDESLRGVEIIDSPGVNAQGRVGDITNDYIENANAIMFLKPITGAALESTSFISFLDSKSVERNHNALFLILTRAANENPENLERLQQEALKLYGKTIHSDHIICVDSKVELFINKISSMTVEEIEEHLNELEENGRLDAFISPPRSMKTLNKEKYIDFLKVKSNFLLVDHVLNIFGRKTHYLALSEMLGRMLKVYQRIMDNIEEQIELNKLKAKDPTELAKQIGDTKRKLTEINIKMRKSVDDILLSYTGDSGIIRNKAKNITDDFTTSVGEISNNDINELEKVAFRKIDESKKFQEELEKKIVAECNTALVALSNENKIKYTSLEPDFTAETFEEIKQKTESSAQVKKSYETGNTFKKTHHYSEYSRTEHFRQIKSSIQKRINSIQNEAVSNLINFALQTTETYTDELKENAKIKKEELDRIMEEKKNSEEIQERIKLLRGIREKIVICIRDVNERKGGIDTNV